jgi:shikimate kinase
VRVWLAGLMGSGKSTVGRSLAACLGCGYVDNDEEIRRLAGRSTVDLAADGSLHAWESRYVSHVARLPSQLIAGIPASAADRPSDLRLLRDCGYLVYLRCDLASLAARVRKDPPRPWLSGDPEPLLAGMFEARDPVLSTAADLVVDGGASVADLVNRVVEGLASQPPPHLSG